MYWSTQVQVNFFEIEEVTYCYKVQLYIHLIINYMF